MTSPTLAIVVTKPFAVAIFQLLAQRTRVLKLCNEHVIWFVTLEVIIHGLLKDLFKTFKLCKRGNKLECASNSYL